MDLLNSIIVFFLLGFIWTAIVFLSFKKFSGQNIKRDSRMLFGGLLLFLALAALFFVGTLVFEEVESSEFCGTSCHVMEPFYETYEEPENNKIMTTHVDNDITCANCHDKPRIDGKIYSLSLAIPEAVYYYTGSYDPDDLGGHVTPEYCLKCHDGSVAEKPGEVETTIKGTFANPHEDKPDCVECHNPHQDGMGLTENACTVCHGTNIENFATNLDNHGITSQEDDCMDCHDRWHQPENPISHDARIPFNDSSVKDVINDEFCADCHDEPFSGFSNWPDEKKSIYSDCTNACHIEHKYSPELIPHNNTQKPYPENCFKCHDGGVEDHDFSNVCYSGFVDQINNEYCKSCHQTQYTLIKDHSSDECTKCHEEHAIIPSTEHSTISPFDECSTCHQKLSTEHNLTDVSLSDFPDEPNQNEFCQSCHSEVYDRLDGSIHETRDCLECHNPDSHQENVEKNLSVQFDGCTVCHTKIPPGHTNGYDLDCADCHDNKKMHAEDK
jgi:hypothetical protein